MRRFSMSSFRFRRLERYKVGGTRDHMTLSIPIPKSPSGKAYQYSPNPEAIPRLFLIGDAPVDRVIAANSETRIRRAPGPGTTVCPYSGYEAPDEDFIHFDDVRSIKEYIFWAAQQDVGDFMTDLASEFNRQQPRNSFVSISAHVKKSYNPRPLAIREDLLREVRCDICQRPYGVYAISLFCPDCGAPNLSVHFRREAELVDQQVFLANQQQESPELAYRLMGNAHEDVLTAFEATLKTAYKYLVRHRLPDQATALCSKKTIGNAFQNVNRARDLFAPLGIDPFNSLNESELAFLLTNIQKRHIIGHNLGVADEHYNDLTHEEQPGETVHIIGEEIQRFASISAVIIATIDDVLVPPQDGTINGEMTE